MYYFTFLIGLLKESLHIILMVIFFLEINQLYSLGYRQMITQEKISKKYL